MKKKRQVSEIFVPLGYEPGELMDTDDGGYDFEDAILYEEVKIAYERDAREAERV